MKTREFILCLLLGVITLIYLCSSERAMNTLEEHIMIFLIGVLVLLIVGIVVVLLPYINLWNRKSRIAAAIRRRDKAIKVEEIRRNRIRLLSTMNELYRKKTEFPIMYKEVKLPSWYYDYLDGKLKV